MSPVEAEMMAAIWRMIRSGVESIGRDS